MPSIERRKFLFYVAGLALGAPLAWSSINQMYTVRKGDTLSAIARRYGTTVNDLRKINGIRGSLIKIGQKLRIPSTAAVLGNVISVTNRIKVNRKKWKYIVAHHSATSQGSAKSFDQVDRRHGMKNGLAYHFVIGNGKGTPDGVIEIGARWKNQLHGGHVSKWEFNNHGIGICLVGNFENSHPSTKQLSSFRKLVTYLGGDLLDNKYTFKVHKEINATLCPGRYFPTDKMHKAFG